MHYHRQLFEQLDVRLAALGYTLHLLAGREKAHTTGRVALTSHVARHQTDFELREWPIGNFKVRYQHQVAAKIKELQPAVVVTMCHAGTLSEWQIMRMKSTMPFKLIAWQCGYEFNPGRIKAHALAKFVPRFDHHLAYHSNAKKYAIAHGARPDQVTVMHNTINEAGIHCMEKTAAREFVANKLCDMKGKRIVLYVGAVLEEKRLELVFEALDILARPDVIFLMVGDGPHLAKINDLYGHRPDFISTGQIIEGVGPYFDAADVFVLPGTGGLAINEAMAHGLAVVSGYADGSADDLVIDGQNGYRLRTDSAQELAARLRDVLADPTAAAAMGANGREMIRGDLSFERFIERVVTVIAAQALAGNCP